MRIKKAPNIKKWTNEIKKAPNKLNVVGNEVIHIIKSRTLKGIDIDNKSFKKYSSSYAILKINEFGSSTPNLTRSGNMLNNITYNATNKGIILFFSNLYENKKAYKNNLSREFFGVNKKELKYIKDRLMKILNFR